MMGFLVTLEYWPHADLAVLNKEWQERVELIAKLVYTVPGITTMIATPTGRNSYPTLTVVWDEKQFGLTVEQCSEQVAGGRAPH